MMSRTSSYRRMLGLILGLVLLALSFREARSYNVFNYFTSGTYYPPTSPPLFLSLSPLSGKQNPPPA